MKKILSTLLSVILGISALPCIPVSAQDNIVTISAVNVDMQNKTVNVTGKVSDGMGYRTVTIRAAEKGTDFTAPAVNAIQNIAEIQTDILGNFNYSFELNTQRVSAGTEMFDLYATYANTGDTYKTEFSVVNSYDSVMKDSVIMNIGNKNAIVYGERTILNSEPYAKDGGIYVNAGVLNKIFNTELSGEVELNTLNGKKVYTDNNIILISEKEVTANVGLFVKDFGIYVSKNGNDEADGRVESPVKTLARALELTESFRGFDGCRIYIKGGDYNFGESVAINEKKNIIIDSYADEAVTVNASIKFSGDDFHKVVSDEILSRVGKAARAKLMYLDLGDYMSEVKTAKALGLNSYYKLYADGRKQQLARYPDVGYDDFTNVSGASEIKFHNNERSANWNADSAYLVWFNNVYTIWRRQFTCTDGTVSIDKIDMNGSYGAAVNILDELTMPGEWYIDVPSKRLYYCPDGGISNVELTTGGYSIFDITNSQNITIKNIQIGKNNTTAVKITDCDGVVLDNTEILSAGGRGVSVTKSKNCAVKNSEIHDVAACGVFVSGGDIPSLTPGNNSVENCHIYEYAPESTNTAGVSLEGMGNTVKNNVIHDSASQGVYLEPKSNGMLIENNEIYNVVRGLSDAGAIYGINVKEYTGTKILNNYVHDLTKSYKNWGGVHGIYLDNGTSGFTVSNNIVSDSLSAGLISGGRDNKITNNMFIDCSFEKFDTRVKLGGWLRGYKNWAPEVVNADGYDEEKWKNTYDFWQGLLDDSAKEKAYLDSKKADGTYDEDKYFDAGSPWNGVIKNNLTIAQKKVFGMNPVEIWWDFKNEKYNLTYEDNLSVMGSMRQKAELSGETVHGGSKAMKYEIIQGSNTAIKKLIGEKAKPGEIYKISAWIYADTVKNSAKAKISTDKNPANIASVVDFPYNIEGSGEVNLPEGSWTQVYCYWVSNSNKNSAVISFTECSVGDIFYIDDVTVDRVLYSEQALPLPGLNDIYSETEYKYKPKALDLSETKAVLNVGESTPIEAYNIFAEENDSDGNGIVDGSELNLRAEKAVIASAASDNDVISVSDGTITALSGGIAKLTVTDTNGNTASISVVCKSENDGIYRFDGNGGYVSDSDPVYEGEAYRPYSTRSADTGITAADGMILGFTYYDSGLSKTDAMGSVNIGFTFNGEKKTLLMEDRWIPGLAEIFASGYRWSRSAGWHRLICKLTDKGNNKLKLQWYCDGVPVYTDNTGIDTGSAVSIYASANKSTLPVCIKNVFTVSGNISSDSEITSAESFILDDFENGEISWTTVSVDLLDGVYEGNDRKVTDEISSWFEDFDNRDLTMKENSSLFTIMPQFKPINFANMGNTVKVNRHEQEAPIIRLADIGDDKTVTFIWNNVSGASSYRLVISKTEDMSQIVYKNTLDTNTDKVWLPETGEYYCTVTAVNLSKNYRCETVSEKYCLSIDGSVKFNRTEIVPGDAKRYVSFIYDCDGALAGKVILAQKDSSGKLISTAVSDIPKPVGGQITISGYCDDGNTLECYLWNGINGMKPYCSKEAIK